MFGLGNIGNKAGNGRSANNSWQERTLDSGLLRERRECDRSEKDAIATKRLHRTL